jgi:hypothetical protein
VYDDMMMETNIESIYHANESELSAPTPIPDENSNHIQ